MKKVLIIVAFLTVPFLTVAQSNTLVNEEVITVVAKDTAKTETSTKQSATSKFKAEAVNMNHKKSNDIISIKAYRKSLQIKVAEIKLC
ncbi:hypothetical protein ACFO5O_09425 [Geojedonia litorea]|uniref:Uncharacterized protein n=1 Tax=Geojedonia litorea TaxID=1268269 RepID=A0ABV9N2N8_9FLAO